MKKIHRVITGMIALGAITFVSSCVKNEFDAPITTNSDPDLAVSMTISQLQSLATGTTPVLITSNEIIAGIVTADDLSGNFYKEVILQDSTGAIAVFLDQSNYNTLFPIGRRVFVKCQDLYIADDGDGNFQLGTRDQNTIGRIPGGLVAKYMTGGKWGLSVEPVVVALADLNTVPTQMLVHINDVQFDASDTGITYANALTQQSGILEIEDCSNNFVDLYTSGYATFAGETTPAGKGSLTAIYKLYSGDPELLIRNTNDVNMTGSRCGAGGSTTILKSIQQIKDTADTSGTIIIPDGWTIRGTVISDVSQGNITAKNIAVQEGAHGIIVRFTANNSALQLNDSVQIDLTGGELYYYFGLLEVDQIPNARATVLGTGTIVPNPVTVSQIESDVNLYQSTLVILNGVTLSGNTTFSGSITVTQGGETINMFTSTAALFAGDPLPGGTVNLVGLVNVQSGNAEMKMRNASDVQ